MEKSSSSHRNKEEEEEVGKSREEEKKHSKSSKKRRRSSSDNENSEEELDEEDTYLRPIFIELLKSYIKKKGGDLFNSQVNLNGTSHKFNNKTVAKLPFIVLKSLVLSEVPEKLFQKLNSVL